jgi:transposase
LEPGRPGQQLHVVCDNYAIHNHPGVRAWLADNPRVNLHFTPTGCSWLNMVVRHEVACDEWNSSKEDRLMSMT